jgi:hypothetical protein
VLFKLSFICHVGSKAQVLKGLKVNFLLTSSYLIFNFNFSSIVLQLFTEDAGLCYNLANTTGQYERIEQEIEVSIFGVGLSLVNNCCFDVSGGGNNHEIAYMSISSSGIFFSSDLKNSYMFTERIILLFQLGYVDPNMTRTKNVNSGKWMEAQKNY